MLRTIHRSIYTFEDGSGCDDDVISRSRQSHRCHSSTLLEAHATRTFPRAYIINPPSRKPNVDTVDASPVPGPGTEWFGSCNVQNCYRYVIKAKEFGRSATEECISCRYWYLRIR